jgi:hypothetical protein
MNEVVSEAEVNSLAVELANSFGKLLRSYQATFKLTPEQAVARIQDTPDDFASRILERPPDQLEWYDLSYLADHHPHQFFRVWQAIKKSALEEVQCGDRAARVVEGGMHLAWQRAQFLALRAELSDSFKVTNGIERQLIDTMAQAQTAYFYWLERSMARASMECVQQKKLERWRNCGRHSAKRLAPGPARSIPTTSISSWPEARRQRPTRIP